MLPCWRGDLVQERHGDLPPGRSGHQLADTNVVDSKWRLLTGSTVLYNLGLQRHFRLLTPWDKRYWLSGDEGGAYLSVQCDIFRPPGPNYPHRCLFPTSSSCFLLQLLCMQIFTQVTLLTAMVWDSQKEESEKVLYNLLRQGVGVEGEAAKVRSMVWWQRKLLWFHHHFWQSCFEWSLFFSFTSKVFFPIITFCKINNSSLLGY